MTGLGDSQQDRCRCPLTKPLPCAGLALPAGAVTIPDFPGRVWSKSGVTGLLCPSLQRGPEEESLLRTLSFVGCGVSFCALATTFLLFLVAR